MFRIVYCVFLVCLITAAVQAQTTVSGKITDQNAGPLRAVTVHLLNTSISVISDKEGNFRIADLRPGNYIIELSAIGYASLVREITVDKNNTPLLISMQNSMLQLDAVTVTAEKREELLQRIPASVTVLNAKQVQDFNMWDIKQLTAIVPNLYSGNSGDMRNVTSIRGITTTSYDPAVATYIDGVNQFSLDTYIAQLFDVERIEILRSLGADLILTSRFEGTDGAQEIARSIAEKSPDIYFYADQYKNENNWKAHFNGTAVEILHEAPGITHFVTGLGTTGSFIGTARRLKKEKPSVRLISLEPDSALHGLEGWKHLETAHVPGIYDSSVADENLEISTEEAYDMIVRVQEKSGLILSPSSAANLVGAIRVASSIEKGIVVTLLPDNGDKYGEVIKKLFK